MFSFLIGSNYSFSQEINLEELIEKLYSESYIMSVAKDGIVNYVLSDNNKFIKRKECNESKYNFCVHYFNSDKEFNRYLNRKKRKRIIYFNIIFDDMFSSNMLITTILGEAKYLKKDDMKFVALLGESRVRLKYNDKGQLEFDKVIEELYDSPPKHKIKGYSKEWPFLLFLTQYIQ